MALKGSTNEEKIWNYLKGNGLNDCGTAGLMGNLQAESGLNSKNIQNSFEKKLGFTDESYTMAVDSGTYKNFVRDSAGYGIAQWTFWSRKQSLMNFATSRKSSIGDLEMQLDFLMEELKKSYPAVLSVLRTSKTVRGASNAVLLQFEKPADKGGSVQEKRFQYSMEIYNRQVNKASNEGEETSLEKMLEMGFLDWDVGGIRINSSIKCSSDNYTTKVLRSPSYVVVHYTGNIKDCARNNATYFSRGGRNASAHFFVDDAEIYQSVAIKDMAWHCGAKTYFHETCRNANSIGVEMCCTAGNYRISDKTMENAAQLVAMLCRMCGITYDSVDIGVLRHYDVTHKKCPAQMVNSPNEWTEFKAKVKRLLSS